MRLPVALSMMVGPSVVARTARESPGPPETLGLSMPKGWDHSEEAIRAQAPVWTNCRSADPSAPNGGGREWVSLSPRGQLSELEGIGQLPRVIDVGLVLPPLVDRR